MKNKLNFRLFRRIITGVLIVIIILMNYISPLKVGNYSTKIETPNINNPNEKIVTYKAIVKNKSNKPIDFKLIFKKDDKDAEWYVYYNIIPDDYVTEIYHIKPKQFKTFESKVTVNSEDSRLVTSTYENMKIKYEIINK